MPPRSPARPTRGAVIGRRYRLEEPLGSGSSAAVWRARDLDLGRPVALKLLTDDADPELRQRFGREAQILQSLRHPDLVEVLGSGEDGGRPFLVMELLDGPSLADLLAGGPMDPDRAAALAADVAAGLARAHAAGVVHRDIKPANIVCTADGTPRLVDFGIARSSNLTTMTQADLVLGTAAYLSPEQARAEPLDARSDVYSLGCVLHELLVGRPPFTGRAVEVATQHVHAPVPPLRAADPGIPAGLEAIVLRCLAKDREHRYGSAAELEADLRRHRAGETPVALAGGDDDPGATTVLAPPDGTLVMPAVAAAADADGGAGPGGPVPPAPPARPKARLAGGRPRVVLAAIAAVVLLLGLLALTSGGGGAGTVALDDLRGRPYTEAAAAVSTAGLVPVRVDVPADAAPGTVVGMMPGPGEPVAPGTEVRLEVAQAPEPPPDDDDDGDGGGDDQGEEKGNKGKGNKGKDD